MKTYNEFLGEGINSKFINDEEDFNNVDEVLLEYKNELKQIVLEKNPDMTDIDINVMFQDYKEDIEECFSNDTDVEDCYDIIIKNYE